MTLSQVTKFSFVLLAEDGQKVWDDGLPEYVLEAFLSLSQLKGAVLSEVV